MATVASHTAEYAPFLHTTPPPREVELAHGTVELIDRLAPAWQALLAESGIDEPSFRPGWIAAHLRAREPGAAVILATVREQGRLRGLLPLVEERGLFGGVLVRRWRAPVDRVSPDRLDIIHAPGQRETVVAALWECLRTSSGWDMLDLVDVPAGGAMHDLLTLAARDGFPSAARQSRETPYVSWRAGATLDQALAHTSAKFRANLRRRRRNLEQRGPVSLVRSTEADPRALDQFFTLEAAGWKGRRGSAIALDQRTRYFYERLARAAADRGQLSLYSLECDGAPVAMHFGLIVDDRYFVPKLAYNESWHEFAPGHLLVQAVIADCLQRGLTEFDFLGCVAPWKMEWATGVRSFSHCFVFSRGAAGRAAHAVRFQILPAGRQAKDRLMTLLALGLGSIGSTHPGA